jgi:hypothetical protein
MINLFRDQHKVIIGLIRQLEGVTLRAPEMVDGVRRELHMTLHRAFTLRKKVLYPKLKDSFPEVDEFDNFLTRTEKLNDLAETSAQSLEKLQSEYMDLYGEEEHFTFPMAQDMSAFESENLREALDAENEKFNQLEQYKSAQPAVVQNPNGGEQKRIAS